MVLKALLLLHFKEWIAARRAALEVAMTQIMRKNVVIAVVIIIINYNMQHSRKPCVYTGFTFFVYICYDKNNVKP